jgi:hypothetical protein
MDKHLVDDGHSVIDVITFYDPLYSNVQCNELIHLFIKMLMHFDM